jgi:lia operon protein LiaG
MIKQKREASGAGLVLGLITGLMLATAAAAQAQRYELSGEEISIYNLAGTVKVRAGSGSQVVVELTRGGADGDQLSVETGAIRGSETLRVIYPDDLITYPGMGRGSRTEVRVRDDGTFGDSRDDWGFRGRGDRVRIEGRGRGLEAYADMTISVPRGQRINVYLAVGEASVTSVEGDIRIDTQSAPVTANGIRGSLVVDVGSGRVDVIDVDGDLNVDTGSGSVEVNGVSGGSALIDTGSGSVTASGITATELNIDTGSGRITARDIAASDIRLDTGSGSVDLDVLNDPDLIEIDTGSGGVTLTVPESYGARVEIDTGSGGIEMEMPITMRRWRRDHVNGTIGDGTGTLIIDTGSGSVRVLQGG